MNVRPAKVWNYFEIAAEIAFSKDFDRHFFLGAVGVRNDGAIVSSLNGMCEEPNRLVHAEYKLSRKLDVGSVVFVARVAKKDKTFAMAKPCFSCEKVMRSKGVKKCIILLEPINMKF